MTNTQRRRSLHVDHVRHHRHRADRRQEVQELIAVLLRYVLGNVALLAILAMLMKGFYNGPKKTFPVNRVDLKGLEQLIGQHQFVAALWLGEETEQKEAEDALESVSEVLRLNFSVVSAIVEHEEIAAKALGIKQLPAMSFLREGELSLLEWSESLTASSLLSFVTQEEHLRIPERIEHVNLNTLRRLVESHEFVTALVLDHSETSLAVANEMESIDDEADVFSIHFVQLNEDEYSEDELAAELQLPRLLYFRHAESSVYDGDLMHEEDVLEWLIQQQTLASNESVVELVDESKLAIMQDVIDHLLVFFFDDSERSQLAALDKLEEIDDECDDLGISMVKVDDPALIAAQGIGQLPKLVYFNENRSPVSFPADIDDQHKVLDWVKRNTYNNEDMADAIVNASHPRSGHHQTFAVA